MIPHQLSLLAATAGGAGDPPWYVAAVPWVLMFGILWFFILRPQMKKQKTHFEKVSSIKKGDRVVTAGGLVGKVVKADDDYVEIDLGGGTKVKAVRNTIADIVPPGSAKAAND